MYNQFLKGLKVAIYLRKSRKDLEEEARAALNGEVYDTLQRHRIELLRFAQKEEIIIIDIFEEVISGSTLDNRGEINNLLTNVKQKKYDAVLCIAYDRLTRGDKEDQGKIENTLKKSDTLIITPSKIYDLNSEEGESSADVDSFISRMEFRRIRRRLEDGKKRSVLEGKNVSSKIPYGFTKNPITKKLEPFEEEASIVRLIYNLSIEGIGTAAIATKLFNMNITTKKGNYFSKKTVADIIKNPKNKGSQFYGATKNGNKTKNPTYTEDAHTGIVSAEDWNLANNMLKKRNPSINQNKELKNPFATILKCSFCDKTLKAVHTRGIIRLTCTTFNCICRSATLEIIEGKVIEKLYEILNNIDVEVKVEESTTINELLNQKQKIEGKIQDINVQRTSIHELLEKRIYTPETFLERQNEINTVLELYSKQLDQLNIDIENELNRNNNIQNLKPIIINCMEIYFKSTPSQKNRLLKSFINEIKYTRKKEHNLTSDISLEIILK